jgi:Tfp pilus assembly protein PilO
MKKLTDFSIGLIIGFVVCVIIMSLVLALVVSYYRNKEQVEYAERIQEVEMLREDYLSRDSDEYLELPHIRGAADRAASDFDRRRDELLHKFRSELAD